MEGNLLNLIVDAGNTQVKLVCFEKDQIVDQKRFDAADFDGIKVYLSNVQYKKSILSSVQSNKATEKLSTLIQPTIVLTKKTALPISLENYTTAETLGADRIANAVAANHLSKTNAALVIDVGTCIKYDVVDGDFYLGGGISPGLQMRFKALHDYTDLLPKLKFEENVTLIGNSTKNAILSGVILGMTAEINGIAELYTEQFQSLTIFLTGGDAKRFDKALKNSIFAEENLTVKGLNIILKNNG
jgi:type III pantothenate kinase